MDMDRDTVEEVWRKALLDAHAASLSARPGSPVAEMREHLGEERFVRYLIHAATERTIAAVNALRCKGCGLVHTPRGFDLGVFVLEIVQGAVRDVVSGAPGVWEAEA